MREKTTTCPCCAAVCKVGSDNGAYWFEPLQGRPLRERIAQLEQDVAILRQIVLRETLSSISAPQAMGPDLLEAGPGKWIGSGSQVPSALRQLLGEEDAQAAGADAAAAALFASALTQGESDGS